jgi:FkbM family methyltransferase
VRRGNIRKDNLRNKITTLLQREDFRQNPARAVFRRVAWRARWSLYPRRPWLIRAHDEFPFFTTRSGSGALIYYQGSSEPEIADFVRHVLKPGMVFVDVGAHQGEYTVLASKLLGCSGSVHAFEPHPGIGELLRRNVRLNECSNVVVCSEAAWDVEAVLGFELNPESSLSAVQGEHQGILGTKTIEVRTMTLDRYFANHSVAKPNLIKVDVEGAELHVLRGATSLLVLPPGQAPAVVFEYGPSNARRFGYAADDTVGFLRKHGYAVYSWHRGELVCMNGSPTLPRVDSTCNLIATKLSLWTSSKLRDRQ